MTDRELDIRLRKILLDATEREMEYAEKSQMTFQPSKAYQRSIKRMLKNPNQWAKQRKHFVRKQALRTIAAVFLIIILGFGSILAISPTARAAAKRWVAEWHETHIIFRYYGNPTSQIIPQYEITELPEGYSENTEKRMDWSDYVLKQYENEDGKIIVFDYAKMQNQTVSSIGTEYSTVLSVNINGMDGILFLSDDPNTFYSTLTWFDMENNLQFTLDAMMGKEEILHMAESASLCKDTK